MGTKKSDSIPAKSPLKIFLIAGFVTAAAGFGALYVNLGGNGNDAPLPKAQSGKPSAKIAPSLKTYSKGHMITFVARSEPQDLPGIKFVSDDGSEKSLKEWRGKVVLLNLWATWCAPCRKEMPALDKLKADLGGDDFDLVALSIDRTGLDKPRKFLKEIGVKHLKLYNNSTGKLAASLKVFGMPTTLLLNREGKELGRLVGPAEWGSDDAIALIRAAIADKG
ncbi:MAG: TlpA family protein disulfide reductase [Alphaproteobacteria bacterium]